MGWFIVGVREVLGHRCFYRSAYKFTSALFPQGLCGRLWQAVHGDERLEVHYDTLKISALC